MGCAIFACEKFHVQTILSDSSDNRFRFYIFIFFIRVVLQQTKQTFSCSSIENSNTLYHLQQLLQGRINVLSRTQKHTSNLNSLLIVNTKHTLIFNGNFYCILQKKKNNKKVIIMLKMNFNLICVHHDICRVECQEV